MIPVATVGEVRKYLADYGDDVRFASSYDGSKPAAISTSMMADCEGEDLKAHGGCEYHDTLVVFINQPQGLAVAPIPAAETKPRTAVMHVTDLIEGDRIDLEPLIEKYRPKDEQPDWQDMVDRAMAQAEYAVVESVTALGVNDVEERVLLSTNLLTFVLHVDEGITIVI